MRHVLTLVMIAVASVQANDALAQGTAAQREACAPDAVKLCPDTIPDVARTTACMTAHASELSAGCRAVFAAQTPAAPAQEHAPAASAARAPRPVVGQIRRYHAPAGRVARDPDAEIRYVAPRRVIEPPVYTQPGPVIFPAQPYADGSFCSPPYDFCEPIYTDPNNPE